MSNPSRLTLPIWLRLIVVVALVGLVWASQRPTDRPAPQAENITQPPPKPVSVKVVGQAAPPVAPRPPAAEEPRPLGSSERDDKLLIQSVTLKDQSGRVIYKGEIDLAPTLDRIAAGKKLRFPNDGSVFQNRERRLPKKPSGHYCEYVVPTPGEDGPGPQRLVVGEDGETFYTHDHYRTFRRVK